MNSGVEGVEVVDGAVNKVEFNGNSIAAIIFDSCIVLGTVDSGRDFDAHVGGGLGGQN